MTQTPPFTLALDGKPACEIVIPTNHAPNDQRAAQILQSSVEKMSGAKLPITTKNKPGNQREFEIGFPDPVQKTLIRDGFCDTSKGGNFWVYSGGGKGSIYGVTDLLERQFGCRKFSPKAELFPKNDTLTLQAQTRIENPANSFRAVNGDFSQDPDYLDWSRLNTFDEIFGRGYYVHTFNKLVPWGTYFKAHPEYYALLDGKRVIDQVCPSNPEVLKIAIAKLRKEMAAQPDKKVWSVSQNDNFTYCHCPECEKVIREEGSPAGPIIRFVNQVAKAFPDKTISTLAYQFSRSAPKLTKPAPNVQIMLCTIELNRSKPIADDPTSQSFVKDITDWGKITKNIYLWDYTVNFNHHVSPFPNWNVLQPNIRFFFQNGVRQYFQQSNTSYGHDFSELKSYLISKLLWNPDIDFDATMDDFLKGYYGPAAPALKEYIETLLAEVKKAGVGLDIYERPNVHANDYLSAENIANYNRLFDEAEAAVAGNSMRSPTLEAPVFPELRQSQDPPQPQGGVVAQPRVKRSHRSVAKEASEALGRTKTVFRRAEGAQSASRPASEFCNGLKVTSVGDRQRELRSTASEATNQKPNTTNSEYLERVKVARLSLQYATLEIAWKNIFGPRGYFTGAADHFQAKPEMEKTLEDFYSTCIRNGVKTLKESRLTPDEYYKAAKQLVTLQVEGNLAFRKPVTANPPPDKKYSDGDLSLLTNGVRGGSDYGVQWVGWDGVDFDLNLDLGPGTSAHETSFDTLWNGRSWILHPKQVVCYVSTDGTNFQETGRQSIEGGQQKEPLIHVFDFKWETPNIRYIRFHIEGTKTLPNWHPSAGGKSWVFIDEIIAR